MIGKNGVESSSETQGQLVGARESRNGKQKLLTFFHDFPSPPTNCPCVSEDGAQWTEAAGEGCISHSKENNTCHDLYKDVESIKTDVESEVLFLFQNYYRLKIQIAMTNFICACMGIFYTWPTLGKFDLIGDIFIIYYFDK